MNKIAAIIFLIIPLHSQALDKLDDDNLSKEQVSSATSPHTSSTEIKEPILNQTLGQDGLNVNKAIQSDGIKYRYIILPEMFGLPPIKVERF